MREARHHLCGVQLAALLAAIQVNTVTFKTLYATLWTDLQIRKWIGLINSATTHGYSVSNVFSKSPLLVCNKIANQIQHISNSGLS